jgi:hypothetical protein
MSAPPAALRAGAAAGGAIPCLFPGVQSVRLLRRKPTLLRLDVAPWAGLYAAAAAVPLTVDASRWAVTPWILLPLAVLLHGLCGLCEIWFMRWRVLMTCTPVRRSLLWRRRGTVARRAAWNAAWNSRHSAPARSLPLFPSCR